MGKAWMITGEPAGARDMSPSINITVMGSHMHHCTLSTHMRSIHRVWSLCSYIHTLSGIYTCTFTHSQSHPAGYMAARYMQICTITQIVTINNAFKHPSMSTNKLKHMYKCTKMKMYRVSYVCLILASELPFTF